jgi:hypothetical protein
METTEQEQMDGTPAKVELTPNALAGAARDEGDFGFIKFQLGPIAEVGVNGTTIEDVTQVLIDRLEGFQRGPFACAENASAIRHLKDAKLWLARRTHARQVQGVEGRNEPHESAQGNAGETPSPPAEDVVGEGLAQEGTVASG